MKIRRQKSFSNKRNKNLPIVGGYNVNVREDNLNFEKELDEKLKTDKATRKLSQVGLPAVLGALIGATSKKSPGKSSIIGGALGIAAGYGAGSAYDAIYKYSKKQEEARLKVLGGYKKLGHKGYKGQEERGRYRKKYLSSSKILTDIDIKE